MMTVCLGFSLTSDITSKVRFETMVVDLEIGAEFVELVWSRPATGKDRWTAGVLLRSNRKAAVRAAEGVQAATGA